MASGDQPPLQCECRRPSGFERGLIKWSFALLIVGAAALDAFWVMPVQQAASERPEPASARQRTLEPYLRKCPKRAKAPRARRPPPDERELRVIDVKLLSPDDLKR